MLIAVESKDYRRKTSFNTEKAHQTASHREEIRHLLYNFNKVQHVEKNIIQQSLEAEEHHEVENSHFPKAKPGYLLQVE